MKRRLLIFAASILFISVLSIFVFGDKAEAAGAPSTGARNTTECMVLTGGNTGNGCWLGNWNQSLANTIAPQTPASRGYPTCSDGGNIGIVWFIASGSNDIFNDSTTINVAQGSTSARVDLITSVTNCNSSHAYPGTDNDYGYCLLNVSVTNGSQANFPNFGSPCNTGGLWIDRGYMNYGGASTQFTTPDNAYGRYNGITITFPSGTTSSPGTKYVNICVTGIYSSTKTTTGVGGGTYKRCAPQQINVVASPWDASGRTDIQINGGAWKNGDNGSGSALTDAQVTDSNHDGQVVDVYPGDLVYWRFNVYTNASAKVDVYRDAYGFRQGEPWNSGLGSVAQKIGNQDTINGWKTYSNVSYSGYTIQAADTGRTICQTVDWNPGSSSGKIDRFAREYCVYVKESFTTTGETQMKINSTQYNNAKVKSPSNDDHQDVKVGDKVGWNFQIKNAGPSATTSITANGNYNGDFGGVSFAESGTIANGGTMTWDGGTGKSFSSPMTITSSMAGKVWCAYIEKWSPVSGSGGEGGIAAECADVKYNYTITPTSDGNNSNEGSNGTGSCSGSTQIGTGAKIVYHVKSKAGTIGDTNAAATRSKPIYWRVINEAGTTVSSAGTLNGASFANGGTLDPGGEIIITADVPSSNTVGQVVRYRLQISETNSFADGNVSVDTWMGNVKTITASTSGCMSFAKLPQLNIRGADSFANGLASSGKSFAASASTQSMSGSFSQYAIMGNKTIDTFGSGGWNVNGDSANKSCIMSLANVSGLASTCLNGNGLGNAGLARSVETPELSKFISQSDNPVFGATPGTWQGGPIWNSSTYCSTPHVDLGYFQTPGVYKYTSDIQISGGGGTPSESCVWSFATRAMTQMIHGSYIIYVQGNITIADDLNLDRGNGDTSNNVGTTKFAKLTDIPQFTIYATGNIKINSNVSRIDANLISGGTITTCDSGYSSGAADLGENATCGNNLMINGAMVSSGSPKFQRTFGAELSGTGAPIQTPAETVNYTPSLFLAPFVNSGDGNKDNWITLNAVSKPARY